MNELSVIANPLGAAQSRVLCSPTRHVQVALGYPILVAAIAMLIFRAAQPLSVRQFATGALPFLLAISGALLAFVASAAIRRAVLRDYTTGMIDSHRLSAMSGGTIILGYLTGPTSQALVLAGENYLMGLLACTFMPTHPWLEWTLANGIVACAAFPIWTGSALLAVATQGRGSLGGLLFAFGILGGYALFRVVPALVLVLGPLILFIKLGSIASGVTPPASMLLGLPMQAALGATFCFAAVRKVRRADVPAFDAWLGLALLVESVVIGVAGLYFMADLARSTGFRELSDVPRELLFLATWLMFSILAFVPTAASARAGCRWERRRRLDAALVDPRPVGTLQVFACAILILVIPIALHRSYYEQFVADPLKVVGCLMLGVACMAGFFRRAYARSERIFVVTLLFFLLTWVLPVLAEVVWDVYQEVDFGGSGPVFTPTIAFSPAGAAYAVLSNGGGVLWPGLVFQGVLAGLMCLRLPSARRDKQ